MGKYKPFSEYFENISSRITLWTVMLISCAKMQTTIDGHYKELTCLGPDRPKG